MNVQFDWDEQKAASNVMKHSVSFEEAATVFSDPLAAIFDDEEHSSEEMRELLIGHSLSGRLLLVSFTERTDVVRIISARPATRKERQDHEDNRGY